MGYGRRTGRRGTAPLDVPWIVLGAALGWSLLGVGAFLGGRRDWGVVRLTIGLAIACAHVTGR